MLLTSSMELHTLNFRHDEPVAPLLVLTYSSASGCTAHTAGG
jgi:hypothetical protein